MVIMSENIWLNRVEYIYVEKKKIDFMYICLY